MDSKFTVIAVVRTLECFPGWGFIHSVDSGVFWGRSMAGLRCWGSDSGVFPWMGLHSLSSRCGFAHRWFFLADLLSDLRVIIQILALVQLLPALFFVPSTRYGIGIVESRQHGYATRVLVDGCALLVVLRHWFQVRVFDPVASFELVPLVSLVEYSAASVCQSREVGEHTLCF